MRSRLVLAVRPLPKNASARGQIFCCQPHSRCAQDMRRTDARGGQQPSSQGQQWRCDTLKGFDAVVGRVELNEVGLMLPALKRRKEVLLQEDLGDLGVHAQAVEVRYAHVAEGEGGHARKHRQLPDALCPLLLELEQRPPRD